MLNLINVLDVIDDPESFCKEASPILRIIGFVVLGIKIVVPIILIIVGMLDLAKAVAAKKEDEIKTAQNALVKKAVAAVLVFLVATIVGILMSVIGSNAYKKCWECINHPTTKCTGASIEGDDY